ncbi:MAG: hypothetical protein M1376_14700 [Planctomycetes bacterium]|nr:hypothetical protein [Planctomycetota bacterium]
MRPRYPQLNEVIGLFILSFFTFGGCDLSIDGINQAQSQRTISRQAPCAPVSTLDVATESGSITITGTDSNECSVTARIVAYAPTEEEAQELAEQTEIKLDSTDNTVKIRADKPHLSTNRSIAISYEITGPRRLNVLCQSDFGSLSTIDLQGNIKGKTSSGSIKAAQIDGPVDLVVHDCCV